MTTQHCAHIKADHTFCKGYAVSGSRYCFAHDPVQASKRRAAQRKGGEAGRLSTLPESSLSVRKMSDVLALGMGDEDKRAYPGARC